MVSLNIFEENSKIQTMNSSIHYQNLKIQETNKVISREMQKIGTELQNNVFFIVFGKIKIFKGSGLKRNMEKVNRNLLMKII